MRAYLLERPLQFRFSEKIYSRPTSQYSPGQFQLIFFEMQQRTPRICSCRTLLTAGSHMFQWNMDHRMIRTSRTPDPTTTGLGSGQPPEREWCDELLLNLARGATRRA